MPATNRFQLLVEAQARGDAELARMQAVVNKMSAEIARANRQIAESGVQAQVRYSGALKKMTSDAGATGSSIQSLLSNPIQALTGRLAGGTGALSLFAGGITGLAVGIGAAGLGMKSFVQEASEAAFEIRGLSASTGLSIAATDKLRAVAKLSGFDIRNLQEAALDLSQALKNTSGQGETSRQLLRQLGVAAFDAAGKTRPLGDVFTDVLESLSKVENLTDRVNLSRVLGGEDAAKKSQLLISQYDELNRKAVELGFGARDGLLKSLEDSSKELKAFDLQWENVKARLADGVSIPLSFITQGLGKILSPESLTQRPGAGGPRAIGGDAPSGTFNPLGLFDSAVEGQRLASAFRDGQSGTEDGIRLRLTQIAKDRAQLVLQLSSGSLSGATFKDLSGKLAAFTSEQSTLDRQLAFIARARAGAELTIDTNIAAPGAPKAGAPTLGPRRGKDGFLIFPGTSLGPFVSTEKDRSEFGSSSIDPSARAAAQQEKDKRERELNVSFARQFVAFEERRIDLLTGPGGELEAINRIYALKKAGLEQELDYGNEIFDLTERRLQIEQERTLSILSLQRQRREETRGLASDFVGSLQSGDPASFFRREGGRLINQVGTNALTGTFSRIQSTLGGIGAASGFGGLLKGTLFDPANAQPLDRVATATERTAVAAETTAAALTGRSIGGVTLPAGPISSGFDAIRALGPVAGFTGGSGISRNFASVGAGLGSVLTPGGLFAGFNGGSIQQGGGRATTQAGLGIGSTAGRVANIGGSIAALGVGALTAVRGFQQGGLSGITQGITASLGTAALIPGPQQPFIAAAAATAALVGMLLPDPKKARDASINNLLNSSLYEEAAPAQFNLDRLGRGYDTNKRGDYRSMGDVTININALDAGSVMDSREMITDAVRMSIFEGHGINRAMQEAVLAV